MYFLHVNKIVIHLPLLLVCEETELTEAVARKRKQVKRAIVNELDLTKIEGNGEFPCPKCGIMISPEDESEDVYTIVKERVRDDVLEELVIKCSKCLSRIRLTGFSVLKMENV